MLLIKNIELYAPEYSGRNDILICNDKVIAVGPYLENNFREMEVLDGQGKLAVPGFIDQHVHITGGGGENGFASRVEEIRMTDCVRAGVTTVVGVLGTDSRTRSVENLVAKAKALKEEGMTVYCLTGAYEYPSPTITGSVAKDILYIDEVIGVKLAIADHRCSCPTVDEIKRLATEARISGLIAKKPGIVHLHTGAGKAGLQDIIQVLEQTDIPIKHFRPTHMRGQPEMLEFARRGGFVDFTSGNSPAKAAETISGSLEKIPYTQMTLSSDSNGSIPVWNEKKELVGMDVSRIENLVKTVCCLIKEHGLEKDKAFSLITKNVAQALELYPKKGAVRADSDADIVLLDHSLEVDTVIVKGKVALQNKELKIRNYFI